MIDLSEASGEIARVGVRSVANLPLDQRLDYLRVLAALAGADGILGGRELGALEAYCDRFGIAFEHRATVFEAARRIDPKRITTVCARFRGHELRYALLTDLLVIAMTDRTYGDAERLVIEAVAELLDVGDSSIRAMEQYAARVVRASGRHRELRRGDDDPSRDRSVHIAAGVAAFAGVAVALWTAGAGHASDRLANGLLVLGFGMGALVGMTVAVALSAIGFFVARAVFGAVWPTPSRDTPQIIR